MKKRPSSPRVLEMRRKQQRLQVLIAVGLTVLCIGLAVFDQLPDDAPAPPRLDGPDRAALEAATELRITRVPSPGGSGIPGEARVLAGEDLGALRRTLLDEVGFEEDSHDHPGPWYELSVGDDGPERLSLRISQDLRWAQLENRVIVRRLRLIEGQRLGRWLTTPGEDGP